MYGIYKRLRKTTKAPVSITFDIRDELAKQGNENVPTRNTVASWVTKWDEANQHFVEKEDREYTSRKRKLTGTVEESVRKKLKKYGSVNRTKDCVFKNSDDEDVTLEQQAVAQVRDKFFDIEEPKNEKIIFTPHHRKMRIHWCGRQSDRQKKEKVILFFLLYGKCIGLNSLVF